MRGVVAVLLLTLACTPTNESAGVEQRAPAELPSEPEPWCDQPYPSASSWSELPWIWVDDPSFVDDSACTHGCRIDRRQRSREHHGIRVTLRDDGHVEVSSTSSGWIRRLHGEGFMPTRVHWSSWCGDGVVVIAHDGVNVEVDVLDAVDGHVNRSSTFAIDLDGESDPSFDVQTYCADGHTSIHGRGAERAWMVRVPREPGDRVGLVLAPELRAALFEELSDPERELPRERVHTPTRIYDRVADELFALDQGGNSLWHRRAIDVVPGCYDESRFLGASLALIGCSRGCPPSYVRLRAIGDHVLLESVIGRRSLDLYDRDGVHLAHVAR